MGGEEGHGTLRGSRKSCRGPDSTSRACTGPHGSQSGLCGREAWTHSWTAVGENGDVSQPFLRLALTSEQRPPRCPYHASFPETNPPPSGAALNGHSDTGGHSHPSGQDGALV